VRSTAAIYKHGAHVSYFQKHKEAPLLFLSQCSRFAEEQPIRGGIPIIFPWFGHREGMGPARVDLLAGAVPGWLGSSAAE